MPRPTRRPGPGCSSDFAAANPHAAALARLAEAGSRADAGDTEAAAAILEEVAGDGKTGEIYRSLASLERVMLLGSAMDASERQVTLDLLAADGAPFRPLALEQRALMHLDAGDKTAAIADLQAALAEPRSQRRAAGTGATADHRRRRRRCRPRPTV